MIGIKACDKGWMLKDDQGKKSEEYDDDLHIWQ
jgi:hypothetical protein